jgi:hypothetical protein
LELATDHPGGRAGAGAPPDGAADEAEEQEVEEGDAGMTDDPEATDADYIDAPVDVLADVDEE